jgi:hypothetical protein
VPNIFDNASHKSEKSADFLKFRKWFLLVHSQYTLRHPHHFRYRGSTCKKEERAKIARSDGLSWILIDNRKYLSDLVLSS